MPDTIVAPPVLTRPAGRAYRRFALVTILAVYALIFVGGVVRATGSGLGCPDWPRCFGQWVPPTREEQLPPDYKTRYAKASLTPEQVVFDPVLTWIEYLNRLLGALIGLFIVGTAVLAWRALGLMHPATGLTIAGVVMTGVQGWLGAKVVSTALMPLMITLHNTLAQLIVLVLLAGYWITRRDDHRTALTRSSLLPLTATLMMVLGQFYLGLMVRQNVDALSQSGLSKPDVLTTLLNRLETGYLLHRSFSWVVAGLITFQAVTYLRRRAGQGSRDTRVLFRLALLAVLGNMLVGVILQIFDLTAWAQPLHLLLGSALIGVYVSLVLVSWLAPRKGAPKPALSRA